MLLLMGTVGGLWYFFTLEPPAQPTAAPLEPPAKESPAPVAAPAPPPVAPAPPQPTLEEIDAAEQMKAAKAVIAAQKRASAKMAQVTPGAPPPAPSAPAKKPSPPVEEKAPGAEETGPPQVDLTFYQNLKKRQVVVPEIVDEPVKAPPLARPPPLTAPDGSPPPPITWERGAAQGIYQIQVGSFFDPADAERLRAQLAREGAPVLVAAGEVSERPVYRVRLGPYPLSDRLKVLALTDQWRKERGPAIILKEAK